jgi:hypothetical protein
LKQYSTVYQTKAPDYEGITERAKYLKIKLEFGGGRKTKGGESPNAQIIFNLEGINSKISVGRTGRIIVYYPSNVMLKKCLDTLIRCYVPPISKSNLKCLGPNNPLSRNFVLTTTENWNGSGLKLSEATVEMHEWFNPKTGEYTYVIPDEDGVLVPPDDPDLVYSNSNTIGISAIDKDDANGNRIVTGERIRWQMMEELKRITKEHKLTPKDLEKAQQRAEKQKTATP